MEYIIVITPDAFSITLTNTASTTIPRLLDDAHQWHYGTYTNFRFTIQVACRWTVQTNYTLDYVLYSTDWHFVYACGYMTVDMVYELANIAAETGRRVDIDDTLMIMYSRDAVNK